MNTLVKLLTHDDGEKIDKDEQVWHLSDPNTEQGERVLCTQEFYGYGESGCEFKTKTVKIGGIECDDCKKIIKLYQDVKL